MEIFVFLKQVPATESIIQVADDGASIKTDGLKWVINPYDELAVEEALQIRQEKGGTVTIVSLGPAKADEAIRTALAMGADKGLRIDCQLNQYDSLAAARILAATVKDRQYDLLIAGYRAVDDDYHMVGPAVAELLDIPSISMVIEEKIEDDKIRCRCTVDGGTVDVETSLPALITTQRGLNEPRYASLPGIMKAKKKPIEVIDAAGLGIEAAQLEPKVMIKTLAPPPERSAGRMIEGDSVEEKVDQLVKALSEEAKVI